MDLKRAWRNGFLAPLLLAVPLYDLSLGEHNYLIANGNAQTPPAPYATEGDIGTVAAAQNRFTIPEPVLISMLLGSNRAAIDDGSPAVLQFDPQDIFDSPEGSGDGFQELADDIPLIADARLASSAPLSIAFAGPMGAVGTHSPHSAALFTAGGNSGNSSDDTVGALLSDPAAEEQSKSENSSPDSVDTGTENGSPHSVPEPSSLVLLAIGAISVASLMHRKSKIPSTRS